MAQNSLTRLGWVGRPARREARLHPAGEPIEHRVIQRSAQRRMLERPRLRFVGRCARTHRNVATRLQWSATPGRARSVGRSSNPKRVHQRGGVPTSAWPI